MSFRASAFRRLLLGTLLGALTPLSLFAQAVDSPIIFSNTDAITTTFVAAPFVQNTAAGSGQQWMKVEFHYSVAPPKGVSFTYLDSAEFKIWVEGIDMTAPDAPVPGQGLAVAMTGSVTYVNLPVGKDVYGSFYVPPSALGRYSQRGQSDFDHKFNIHLEADVDGKIMDAIDKTKETDRDWYKPLKMISGLVYRQNQCAFMLADPDRYPSILLEDSASSSGPATASTPASAPTTPPSPESVPAAPPAQP